MPRYFTLPEAEQMLPDVERALRDVLFSKAEYHTAEKRIQQAMDRIRMAGGVRVDPAGILALRGRREASVEALKQALEQVEQLGVLIKDLDIGLIDFLSHYRGREVCLCWKLGEDRIAFWHGTEEGFGGRKTIDDEFLSHHNGDVAH